MKKTRVLGLLGLLAGVAVAAPGDTGPSGLDNWRKTVSTNGLPETLAAVATLPEDWPAVRSVRHAGKKGRNTDSQQTEFRDLAKTFWAGLERYEKALQKLPPESFCRGAEALLKARERFLKHPSYANYFIVDSINRAVYINLAERLAKAEELPVCYDPLVERLAEFRFDLPQIIPVINDEYGANLITVAAFENMHISERFQTVGEMIGQENFLFIPENMHNMFGLRILEKRSFPVLLHRLVLSDHFIGASLPALLSYRRKAPHFTPDDTYQQINAVFGRDAPAMPPTLCDGRPRPASEAITLLDELRSERWRNRLSFSDPPTFTPEKIEILEKKEAEREAMRRQEEQQQQKATNAATP